MVQVVPLQPVQQDEVIDVFTDAFEDYPLMRWVLEAEGGTPDGLRKLITLFVSRRVMRGGPMLGVFDRKRLVAAATLTRPLEPEPPQSVAALTDDTWRTLGDVARERYQAYTDTVSPFFTSMGAHLHLNMLGVRASHMGRGLARPLLEAVQQMSDDDPGSSGVSLTTERDRNVQLYEHFGYAVVAHNPVSDAVKTWGLFRRRA
jgi:GNAT superfamily N-acetyltransferase